MTQQPPRPPPRPTYEQLRYRLLNWAHFGYAAISGAIEPELIDALMADLDELIENHERFRVMVDSAIHEHRPIRSSRAHEKGVDTVLLHL